MTRNAEADTRSLVHDLQVQMDTAVTPADLADFDDVEVICERVRPALEVDLGQVVVKTSGIVKTGPVNTMNEVALRVTG